jgi:hypothetical protein
MIERKKKKKEKKKGKDRSNSVLSRNVIEFPFGLGLFDLLKHL